MSETKQRIENDIKEAMKNKDNVTRDILRMIKNEINKVEVNSRKELSEQEVIDAINRYKKIVQDQINEAKNEEHIQKFTNELNVVMKYLPKQLTEEEVTNIIKEIISVNGYEGKKDMGKVMKELSPKIKGAFDGKKANQIVIELLEK
jgi:Uncharacterized conserved protein